MSTGVGTDVSVGFAIETTPNTRQAPDTFLEILQESMTVEQEFVKSSGLGGGRRFSRRKILGNKTVGGSISMEARTAGMVDLLRLCLGGDPTPTGTGPYVREFGGGGDLPTATFQINKPYSPTLSAPFDFIGSMVNSWTWTQNAGEFAQMQMELFSHDAVFGETEATFAPPADPGLITFADLTVTTPDGEVCFDSITLTGTNTLGRSFKACADDPGLASVRPDGMRMASGALAGDFDDMTAFNRYLAGTEGALTVVYNAGPSKILSFDMNIYYTGETPTVAGPGVVTQGIPFEVISGTSDAAAITVTLTNDES